MSSPIIYDAKIPTYALSYLINADCSGLEDSDIAIIDKWYNMFVSIAAENDKHVIVNIIDADNTYFTHKPAFGLACDVTDCQVIIR